VVSKFSFRVACVCAVFSLAACQDQEGAAKELLSDFRDVEAKVSEAILSADFELAEQLRSDFEGQIRSVVNENFEGDFCTIPFEGIDCNASSERAEIEDRAADYLVSVSRFYERMVGQINANSPATAPALASYRSLITKGNVIDDLLVAFSKDSSLRAQITLNAMQRGSYATCSDMRELSNEFKRDEAYVRLVGLPSDALSYPSTPIKGMIAIEGGSYDIEQQEFQPTGDEATGRERKAYRVTTGIDLRNNVGEFTATIDGISCSREETAQFIQELQRRGDASNIRNDYLPREINVTYRINGLSRLLREPIPVEQTEAEDIVNAFTRSRERSVQEDRPFLVTINFRPDEDDTSAFDSRGNNDVTITASVDHVAYYPITEPHVTDSRFYDDFYISLPPHQTFENSAIPSIQPIFQREID
jgi:hypothetical protein